MEVNNLEIKISKVLRVGVLISGIILICGWMLTTIEGGSALVIFKDYDRLSLGAQVSIAYKNSQWGILTSFVGLATLILLPVLRVALTSLLFFYQKETRIGLLSLLVLLLLFVSFFLGLNL
jgi:uncharacterized membrane protein